MASCSLCGRGIRFGSKCGSCKLRPPSRSDLVDATDPSGPVPGAERFRVTRLSEKMVFGVLDTLTSTLREVTNDPLDAAEIVGRLNNDCIYARGHRWKAPTA